MTEHVQRTPQSAEYCYVRFPPEDIKPPATRHRRVPTHFVVAAAWPLTSASERPTRPVEIPSIIRTSRHASKQPETAPSADSIAADRDTLPVLVRVPRIALATRDRLRFWPDEPQSETPQTTVGLAPHPYRALALSFLLGAILSAVFIVGFTHR